MSEFVNLLEGPFLDHFEERQAAPIEAVPMFLPTWNQVSGDDGGRIGLPKGWFVTVGGNPGFGKSLFSLNVARSLLEAGQPVVFHSFEMSKEQLAGRFYSMATGTDIRRLERGDGFTPEGFQDVRQKIHAMQIRSMFADFYVAPRTRGTQELLDSMRAALKVGVRHFILDYLQLVTVGSEEALYRQVSELCSELMNFTREHEATVIGLSQFNRGTSSNYAESPRSQGLHGGMAIEANCDQVLLLDHSRYMKDPTDPRKARSWLVIDKNRHGDRGAIPIEWDYRTLTVREARPDEEPGWPEHDRRAG